MKNLKYLYMEKNDSHIDKLKQIAKGTLKKF